MPDFSAFVGLFTSAPIVLAMLALGVVIFAPTYAKWGIDKLESMFGISFKEGLSRLERQQQEKLGRSMARDAARDYYKNNPNKRNRSVPWRGWRNKDN